MKRSQLELTFARQIRFAGLPEAVTEFKFHEARRWRADFAWPECKIIAEIEGGEGTHWINLNKVEEYWIHQEF